jgi:hemerythrin-like domain-containing protein
MARHSHSPERSRAARGTPVRRRSASPRRTPASPYAPFRRDHARVLARLRRFEASLPDGRGRALREPTLRALIAHLERQFATHMAAEEAVLFPALEHAFPESAASLRPLQQEHAELRTMLASLARTLARPASHERDEQVLVQAHDFADLLRIHIRKEESVVFDVSERVLQSRELRGLARRLAPFVPANAPRPRPRRNSRSRKS